MKAPLYQEFIIFSEMMQENLTIKLSLPVEYNTFHEKEFSSIYLLDANYFFDDSPGLLDEYLDRGPGMTKIVQTLTAQGKIPPCILIGIGYTEEQRNRFTREDVSDFYAFFLKELIPLIESKFRVSQSGKDRVLFGYSSSAHFSTYALMLDVFSGVETFSKFISISGVYYPHLEVYKLEQTISQEANAYTFSDRRLFIAVGSDDPKTDLLAAHRTFTERLTHRSYPDFRLINLEYPGKGHYDIPEFAFREGLVNLFSE